MKEKITPGTIIRALCLILALTNLTLETMGKKVIPISDEQISTFVTLGATIIASLVGYWKNNSFTQEAIVADGIMHDLKFANKHGGVNVEIDPIEENADGESDG